MFGGAVGTEIGSAFLGGFAATGLGEFSEKTKQEYINIIFISETILAAMGIAVYFSIKDCYVE